MWGSLQFFLQLVGTKGLGQVTSVKVWPVRPLALGRWFSFSG